MSHPSPPSPPVISRDRDDEGHRTSSRSHHRTARDYRASRSHSRGRVRSSRSRSRGRGRGSRSPDRKHRNRLHSRSRSRESNRYHSNRRHRHERSRSKSKGRGDRRRRNSHRSRSRSYSRTHKSSHRSRSRSDSRSHRRHNRSRSRSKEASCSRSRSSRRDDRRSSSKQANVIVLSTESYKDSLKSGGRLSSVREEQPPSSSSPRTSRPPAPESTPSWKLTKADQVGVYSNLEPDEPIDKEKIHKEIEEKLRIALAKEGKVYPYPKPEPSHPVFANDGSFLEIFKKMQQQQTFVQQQVGESMQIHAVPSAPVVPVLPVAQIQQPPPPQLPIFGRRRGGKILKTGVVAKPKAQNDTETGDVKDFWSIYLREVKKYKSTACESDSKTRPLVR